MMLKTLFLSNVKNNLVCGSFNRNSTSVFLNNNNNNNKFSFVSSFFLFSQEKQKRIPNVENSSGNDLEDTDDKENNIKLITLRRRLIESHLYPRRQIGDLIKRGKVRVEKETVTDPSLKVREEETIYVNDQPISVKEKQTKIYLHHKLPDVLVSESDNKGRKLLFPILQKMLNQRERLVSVGRLDFKTTGLLLLTNNGHLSRYLELPSSNFKRTYEVHVHGFISQSKIAKINASNKVVLDNEKILKDIAEAEGVDVKTLSKKQKYKKKQLQTQFEGVKIEKIKTVRNRKNYHIIYISIYEGKNREIRKIFNHFFNVKVSKLIRIRYGDYNLGKLPPGALVEVRPTKKIIKWLKQNNQPFEETKDFQKKIINHSDINNNKRNNDFKSNNENNINYNKDSTDYL
eukprot:TRINITY_DN8036_c2_g1_i1.p1 TRINITY_DN8036_c2_g1~~TRINITY_DN8036_c2_g1_i1.p1  ORF type:complete len:402 (-),score=94.06 TRINITY_DN8036_c2_g1_i1:29-1234(-)